MSHLSLPAEHLSTNEYVCSMHEQSEQVTIVSSSAAE
jgi:hypothetical protein